MSDSDQPLAPDRLTNLLHEGDHEETVACLDRLGAADTDTRKRSLRAVRSLAEEHSSIFEGLAAPIATFLTDEDRAVRLTTAKLFVTLSQAEPTVVLPIVDSLADRLADDEEFYYVRARCAEALGYVALEAPAEVNDPETLANLRIGLSFDKPEVKEKLAKALAYVALGDPSRLRHQVSSLADHLDEDNELVRYHLCTALVVIGCKHPAKLVDTESTLREGLDDENPYVQGRVAETLALLAESDVEVESIPDLNDVDVEDDETPPFLINRMRFLQGQLADAQSVAAPDGVGTIRSVREGTGDVIEAMTSPDEGKCPHCGIALPDSGSLMCPRCGISR